MRLVEEVDPYIFSEYKSRVKICLSIYTMFKLISLRNDYIKPSFLPASSVDGNYLLSCGGDKSLKLWSAKQGTLLKTYTGHGYEVLDADR